MDHQTENLEQLYAEVQSLASFESYDGDELSQRQREILKGRIERITRLVWKIADVNHIDYPQERGFDRLAELDIESLIESPSGTFDYQFLKNEFISQVDVAYGVMNDIIQQRDSETELR